MLELLSQFGSANHVSEMIIYRENVSDKSEFSLGNPFTYDVRSGILEHLLKTVQLASRPEIKRDRQMNEGGGGGRKSW